MTVIDVTLSTNAVIPFREAKAASGNVYHTVLDPATGKSPAPRTGGVLVSDEVVGGALPTSCTVLGILVPLAPGTTEFGTRTVSAKRVPVTLDGEARLFSIKVGKGKQGFRVSGSINRPGGAANRKAASTL